MSEVFRFKQFVVQQDLCSMKVNTDGILLGAWSSVESKVNALDIGTGTGLIALILAQRSLSLNVDAVEIDQSSSQQAAENAKNSIFNDRVRIIHDSIQHFSQQNATPYDLIISNPPFFSGGTFSINENKANVRHTIKLSHADLLFSIQKLMAKDGHFDMILPYIEGLRFIELAAKYDFYPVHITEVLPKKGRPIERLLLRFANKFQSNVKKNMIVIRNSDDPKDYTDAFTELTKAFYLFM
jgi:tRNA1Val (adenine37-N6)-methyltransferase